MEFLREDIGILEFDNSGGHVCSARREQPAPLKFPMETYNSTRIIDKSRHAIVPLLSLPKESDGK